jgi:hypothetical protein
MQTMKYIGQNKLCESSRRVLAPHIYDQTSFIAVMAHMQSKLHHAIIPPGKLHIGNDRQFACIRYNCKPDETDYLRLLVNRLHSADFLSDTSSFVHLDDTPVVSGNTAVETIPAAGPEGSAAGAAVMAAWTDDSAAAADTVSAVLSDDTSAFKIAPGMSGDPAPSDSVTAVSPISGTDDSAAAGAAPGILTDDSAAAETGPAFWADDSVAVVPAVPTDDAVTDDSVPAV